MPCRLSIFAVGDLVFGNFRLKRLAKEKAKEIAGSSEQ